jgi:hypothetical protein
MLRGASLDWRMYPVLAIPEALGEIISGGLVFFDRHFVMKAILPSDTLEFGYSTIAVSLG